MKEKDYCKWNRGYRVVQGNWKGAVRQTARSFELVLFESLGAVSFLPSITVWTVVQTVLTATFNSFGDRQISTPPRKSITPEPIDKKFGTINYVREETSYTKFGRNPPIEGFWANGWNITKVIIFYLYLFLLWSAYRSHTWINFYTFL